MKIVNEPWAIVPTGVKSASFNSVSYEAIAYFGLSIQINVSGSSGLAGTMKLQASNDNVNWIDLPRSCGTSVATITLSGDTSEMWWYEKMIAFKWMRLSVTITSGSATFKGIIAGVRV
jgi:hypothetical protein